MSSRSLLASFLDTLFHTVDGNFQSTQKNKPMDQSDYPLTTGAAYFADERDYVIFVKSLKPQKEVSASQPPPISGMNRECRKRPAPSLVRWDTPATAVASLAPLV